MRLRELFDKPVSYHMSGKDEYSFEIDDKLYRFEFARLNYGIGLNVAFCEVDEDTDECIYTVTDSGHNIKVFSTVVEILRKLLTEFDVKILIFTAEEPNRRKLYLRMVKKLIPDWHVYEIPQRHSVSYRVFSPALSNEEFMEMCKKSIAVGNMPYIPMDFYNYEMCIELLNINLSYFQYIPTPDEKADNNWSEVYKKICLYAVSELNLHINLIPEKYRDYDICSAALELNPKLLNFNVIPKDILARFANEN